MIGDELDALDHELHLKLQLMKQHVAYGTPPALFVDPDGHGHLVYQPGSLIPPEPEPKPSELDMMRRRLIESITEDLTQAA